MRLAVDTNILSALDRGDPQVGRVLSIADEIYVPLFVLAELRAGFLYGTRQKQNDAALRSLLSSPRVDVLLPNEQTANEYALLATQLRKQGTPIPNNDLWIAALVVQHNLTLFARDKHFDYLPQLARV